MMKRKIFTLSQLKIPSKAETAALKESLDRYSPPLSPFIDRPQIDRRTEAQLRAACTAVVQGLKASGQVVDEQAKVDFATLVAMQQKKSQPTNSSRPKFNTTASTKPTTNVISPRIPSNSSRTASNPDSLAKSLAKSDAATSTTGGIKHPERKASLQARSTVKEMALTQKMHTFPVQAQQVYITAGKAKSIGERPKTAPAPAPAPAPESSDSSISTPHSGSSDEVFESSSTAITSPGYTPMRSSHFKTTDSKGTHTIVSPIDTKHGDWVKQELDRRQRASEDQQREPERAPQRPPSRASSTARRVKEGIQDYIRPGSSSGSRPPSRGSDVSKSSGLGGTRTSFEHGWRSWGFSRKSSHASMVNASNTADSRSRDASKKEVDLNRELPPLPGLDQWQEPQPKDEGKQQSSSHIANLMKPSKENRKSEPSGQRQRVPKYKKSLPEMKSKPQQTARPKTSAADSDQKSSSKSREPTIRKREDSLSPWAVSMQEQGVDLNKPPTDSLGRPLKHHPSQRTHGVGSQESRTGLYPATKPTHHHRRTISIPEELTALPILQPQERRHGLKKVLSSFTLGGKRDKKTMPPAVTWNEKFGIQAVVQGDQAPAPMVRY